MRFSGSVDYLLTRNQIAEAAMRKINRLGIGMSPSPEEIEIVKQNLNLMLQQWQQKNININCLREITVFLRKDVYSYRLGLDGYDATEYFWETALSEDKAYGETVINLDADHSDVDAICLFHSVGSATSLTLNGALASAGRALLPYPRKITVISDQAESSTGIVLVGTDANGAAQTDTITLTAAANIANVGTKAFKTITSINSTAACVGSIQVGVCGITTGDYVLVELDDGTFHRDTVESAVQNAKSIVLTCALPSAAADGNKVYTYAAKIARPLDIVSARLWNGDDDETPLSRFDSKAEYLNISDKTVSGDPTTFYYDPIIDNGTLYLYPAPRNTTKAIKALARAPVYDMDGTADNVYFPREWQNAVIHNLAVEIALEFGAEPSALLVQKAAEYLLDARRTEGGSRTLTISYGR